MLVDLDFRDTVLGHAFRLLQGINHLLVSRIEERVDTRGKFIEELVKAANQQALIDFFNLVVAQAVNALHIADKGNQIQFLRINLFKKNRSVGLVNNFHSTFAKNRENDGCFDKISAHFSKFYAPPFWINLIIKHKITIIFLLHG
ncbi:hypothetical protein D3C78_945790 [compost metagenome]